MKKVALLITSLAVLTACGFTYNSVEYNNRVVEQINLTSAALEETATIYNESIPDVMNEEETVNTELMGASYETSKEYLDNTIKLLDLESKNLKQQGAVRTGLETYGSAADLYLENYATMLTYYDELSYKDDLGRVEELDKTLHTHYTTFIEANNDLVSILEGFIEE